MRDRMWEIKQQANQDVLQLYIYGDVESDGYNWFGELERSETSANHFREELAEHKNVQEIQIYINSCGGSVFEGTAIYNQLKRHPAQKTVFIDGFACSIASVIAMAGDKIVMPRNTMMMIHNMWSIAIGNAAELRKAAEDLDKINAAGRQAYLQRADGKISEEELAELMDAETWLTAEQCLAYGFADEYAEEDADMQAAGTMLAQTSKQEKRMSKMQIAIAAKAKEIADAAPQKQETTPAKSLMCFLSGR